MVAFNFKKGFVPDITHGIKCSTIRQTKRCNVGDVMQLYTGQRTKHCQKIAPMPFLSIWHHKALPAHACKLTATVHATR